MEVICLNKEAENLEFTVRGEFNTYEVDTFKDSIQSQLHDGAKSVIIDLSQVPYVTSAGLRAICIMGKTILQSGLKFVICGLTGLTKEVFFVSGFHQVFPPAEDLEAARERISQS